MRRLVLGNDREEGRKEGKNERQEGRMNGRRDRYGRKEGRKDGLNEGMKEGSRNRKEEPCRDTLGTRSCIYFLPLSFLSMSSTRLTCHG